jgi:hypothetical protein
VAESSIAAIEEILRGMRGVRGVGRLGPEARREAARIEAEHEAAAAVPVQNVGVRCAAARAEALVILKDSGFRPPGMPTVYLVEEAGDGLATECGQARDPFQLLVEGRLYRVIGEELPAAGGGHSRGGPRLGDAVFLADTFAMFPERRTGARVPCFFLLPPIPFPELDRRQRELGISRVVSVSPSLAVDMYLRGLHGFDRSNDLATILVGFDT